MNYKDKVEMVRNNIISNAKMYKNKLVGRYYLYIFENQCFEMYYGKENFMHLTGAGSNLSPNQFYELAKKGKLQSKQMYFNSRYPLSNALKKTNNLNDLEKFINEGYFVIKDLETSSEVYPYAITNVDQSVLMGLKEEATNICIPKSFRVKGNVFDKAQEDKLFEIHYILSKTDKKGLYDTVLYKEKEDFEGLSREILDKIDGSVLAA
jgi:hypothetical protein